MWDIEEIHNDNKLFYRIHKDYIIDGKLTHGVFEEKGNGMSTDWEKYSTPTDSVCRAKKPIDNGIVSFMVGDIRNINLAVTHKPSEKNRSHSIVKGKEKKIQQDTEVRFKLMKMLKWEIQVGAYSC